MADAFDDTHTGFAEPQAKKKGEKTLFDRIRLCFRHQVFFPMVYIIGFAYIYYSLFTDAELPSWYVKAFFFGTIGGHICAFVLLKMTSWDETVKLLKEIFR